MSANKLIKTIDKNKIENYRNLKEEYLDNSKYYIPFYIDNDILYGISFISNKKGTLDLTEYLLRGNVISQIITVNKYQNINWAAEYYL